MNKQKYIDFCDKTYVPIYSKSWWLDAVCGPENWNVWLLEKGKEIEAAMPYYVEKRGEYTYITKALLSQNNGIIFNYPQGMNEISKQQFEERVINEACKYIESLNVDVYEQQYHYDFKNWLPFFWNFYSEVTRYTYVLEDLSDLNKIWDAMSSKYHSIINKGKKNSKFEMDLDYTTFYQEHEKIFLKQGLSCPFTFEQWEKIYKACMENHAGKILCAKTDSGNIASLMFLIWDEKSVYQLLGGSMPEYQNLDTYSALIWEGIRFASSKGLKYDFEGSVIKRISKSFREFGGEPKAYFRIRKVFNPSIIRQEAEQQIKQLSSSEDK